MLNIYMSSKIPAVLRVRTCGGIGQKSRNVITLSKHNCFLCFLSVFETILLGLSSGNSHVSCLLGLVKLLDATFIPQNDCF